MLRFVLVLSVMLMAFSLRHPENPPVAHTGGFGEPTCHTCHFDGNLNDGEASLAVLGVDSVYTPGERYELKVFLVRTAMEKAGFQLSFRDSTGRQAGTLTPSDNRAAIDEANGVLYIRHTPEGTALLRPDSTAWAFQWQAPESSGPIHVHLSLNAANGDVSEFGDAIYSLEHLLTTH